MAGNEGDLVSKAQFEEAKLRDLAVGRQQLKRPPPNAPVPHPVEKQPSVPEQQVALLGGLQRTLPIQCYGCGGYGHYRNKCPARGKGFLAEAPGRESQGRGGQWKPLGMTSREGGKWLTLPWRGLRLRKIVVMV